MRPVILLAAALALVPSAYAHAMLVRAAPAVGSTVAATPVQLRLTFSEGVVPGLCRIALTDAAGKSPSLGPLKTAAGANTVLVAPLQGPLASGAYRVVWRAVSVDSHVTQGDYSFTIR